MFWGKYRKVEVTEINKESTVTISYKLNLLIVQVYRNFIIKSC